MNMSSPAGNTPTPTIVRIWNARAAAPRHFAEATSGSSFTFLHMAAEKEVQL